MFGGLVWLQLHNSEGSFYACVLLICAGIQKDKMSNQCGVFFCFFLLIIEPTQQKLFQVVLGCWVGGLYFLKEGVEQGSCKPKS